MRCFEMLINGNAWSKLRQQSNLCCCKEMQAMISSLLHLKCFTVNTSQVFHVQSCVYERRAVRDWTKQMKWRGSDASPGLSLWIFLRIMRSGSRPVPDVSLEDKKVGNVQSKARLTNLTASLCSSRGALLEADLDTEHVQNTDAVWLICKLRYQS